MVELLEEYARVHLDAKNHLPFRTSTIPFEILIKVSIHTLRGDSYSVKKLMIDLPYSNMGIRKHLSNLINVGWLTLSSDVKDRRCKTLTASPQAIEALRARLLNERPAPPPPNTGRAASWHQGLFSKDFDRSRPDGELPDHLTPVP
jgi:DNA-binding MarR family transcriptional regulator